MPLSSVLGASSVIKPGVCTSTTRPSVPYEGQLIYETDTDRIAAWNGSTWVYTHSSGLVLISSTTIGSAVSSVTVTGAFSATYDNYRIIISGGVGSATTGIDMQLGSTTTGYYKGSFLNTYTSATVSSDQQANAANWGAVGLTTANTLNGDITLFGPNLAKNTIFHSAAVYSHTTGRFWSSGGYLADTTQYTAFTVSTAGQTMTGGTIRVYGYANS